MIALEIKNKTNLTRWITGQNKWLQQTSSIMSKRPKSTRSIHAWSIFRRSWPCAPLRSLPFPATSLSYSSISAAVRVSQVMSLGRAVTCGSGWTSPRPCSGWPVTAKSKAMWFTLTWATALASDRACSTVPFRYLHSNGCALLSRKCRTRTADWVNFSLPSTRAWSKALVAPFNFIRARPSRWKWSHQQQWRTDSQAA